MDDVTVRVYELYPVGGGYSVKTIDYEGVIYAIAATSVKQAYYFAYNEVWAKDAEKPRGILWKYNKWAKEEGGDHTFFDGTKGWGEGEPQHGDKKQVIIKWMEQKVGKKEEGGKRKHDNRREGKWWDD
jgi:hypothetical protein